MPSSKSSVSLLKSLDPAAALEQTLRLPHAILQSLNREDLETPTNLSGQIKDSAASRTLIAAIRSWTTYIALSTGAKANDAHAFVESAGFPKLKSALEIAPETLKSFKKTARITLQKIASGRLSSSDFETNEATARIFSDLPKKALSLLPGFIARQTILDATNFNSLKSAFPYSLEGSTYFTHFVTARCEDPQVGLRHLRCAAPFFVNIRSIVEGLRSSRLNAISITSEVDNQGLPKTEQEKAQAKVNASRQKELFECFPNLINNAHLFEANRDQSTVRLRAVQAPRLPKFRLDTIEQKKYAEFSQELFDWLFFGKKDGPLLNLQTLPPAKEANLKEMQASLTRVTKRLGRHEKLTRSTDNATAVEKWKRDHNILLAEQERYGDEIKDLQAERKDIRSVLQQLEADKKLLGDIERFRKECASAVFLKQKLVLCFLKEIDAKQPTFSNFLEFIDDAQFRPKSGGALLLSQAAFLMTDNIANRITSINPSGPESFQERHHRRFFFSTDTFNLSAQLISIATQSRRRDPRIEVLIKEQMNWSELGDLSSQQMTTLVKDAYGILRPGINDFLKYTFQHCSVMSEEQLFILLTTLYKLGIREVPTSCREISIERFNHRAVIWQAFQTFAENFRPKTVGDLPDIFEDLTQLQTYIALSRDSHAMLSEAKQLAEILDKEGVVVIVDGTSYNQNESDAQIEESQGEEGESLVVLEEHSSPAKRLFRNFSRILIEGQVPEKLKNRTIVALTPDDKEEVAQNAMIKRMSGVDMTEALDISTLNQVLAQLAVYDSRTIIALDVEEIEDTENYREFLTLLKQYGFKLIITAREPIPGFAQVRLEHFADEEIPDRIMSDQFAIRRDFKIVAPLERELLQLIVRQVSSLRVPDQDPLEKTLDVLEAASNRSISLGRDKLIKTDIIEALPTVFELPDHHQIAGLVKAVDRFTALAPLAVLGQPIAIKEIAQKCLLHVLRVRTADKPLALMLPGPTGVGKTELMETLAKTLNIPFFPIEGAEYSEPHSLSRLVGSPSGYKGPDVGILVDWCRRNTVGLVFFDEFDKMHPEVVRALMNFWDKGRLTAGDGVITTRPGLIIAAATNAGAELLRHEMTPREVRDTLANSFIDSTGRKVPELIRRFDCTPILSIGLEDFMGVIKLTLSSLTNTFGIIQAGIEVVDIDPSAAQILFEIARDVCSYENKSSRLGFATGINQPRNTSDRFFDMRFVSKAFENAAGNSLVEVVRASYLTETRTINTRRMRLVGDAQQQRIYLVDE